MQFLPASWAQWASDGDGDGVRDRQDLDDAAYAAARYLCASGADLTTGPAWTSAVRSYNHSDAYVLAVHDVAEAYADGRADAGPPLTSDRAGGRWGRGLVPSRPQPAKAQGAVATPVPLRSRFPRPVGHGRQPVPEPGTV